MKTREKIMLLIWFYLQVVSNHATDQSAVFLYWWGRNRKLRTTGTRRDLRVVYPHLRRHHPVSGGFVLFWGPLLRYEKERATLALSTWILCTYQVKEWPDSYDNPQALQLNSAHLSYHHQCVRACQIPSDP